MSFPDYLTADEVAALQAGGVERGHMMSGRTEPPVFDSNWRVPNGTIYVDDQLPDSRCGGGPLNVSVWRGDRKSRGFNVRADTLKAIITICERVRAEGLAPPEEPLAEDGDDTP